MAKRKLIAIMTVVICMFLISGYLIYRNILHQGNEEKNEGKTEGVNELVVTQITHNGMLGTWNLVSIYQDKSIYYIGFTKNQRTAEDECIVYAENGINNLSVSEISLLFSVSNITNDSNYTYIISFSDKSSLNDTEYQTLLGTIGSSEFLMLNDSYVDSDLLDGVGIYLIVNSSGVMKTVYEYGGCAPDTFHQIRDVVEEIKNRRWGE